MKDSKDLLTKWKANHIHDLDNPYTQANMALILEPHTTKPKTDLQQIKDNIMTDKEHQNHIDSCIVSLQKARAIRGTKVSISIEYPKVIEVIPTPPNTP